MKKVTNVTILAKGVFIPVSSFVEIRAKESGDYGLI